MNFRYGLREIARGVHPDTSAWQVSGEREDLWRGSPARELGEVPSLPPWSLDEQLSLNAVLGTADLSEIAGLAPFPDWLGYLGLGLHYCAEAELTTGALTATWTPQLVRMLPPDGSSTGILRGLDGARGRMITWELLGHVEEDFYNI